MAGEGPDQGHPAHPRDPPQRLPAERRQPEKRRFGQRIEVPVPPRRFDSAAHASALPRIPSRLRQVPHLLLLGLFRRISVAPTLFVNFRWRAVRLRPDPRGAPWLDASRCSSHDRGKSTRTGLLALRPSGSRRGTSGASSASALGLCAQSAYSTFVRRVTRMPLCLRRPRRKGQATVPLRTSLVA